jgi:hypothetical protein
MRRESFLAGGGDGAAKADRVNGSAFTAKYRGTVCNAIHSASTKALPLLRELDQLHSRASPGWEMQCASGKPDWPLAQLVLTHLRHVISHVPACST